MTTHQGADTRLAIIGSKGFHSDYGGVEKVVFSVATRLSSDFEPIVYGNRRYCRTTDRVYEGVIAKYLDFPRLKLSGAAFLSLWAFLDALVHGIDYYYVHACGPGFFCFLPRLFRKRVVWHFHGHDYYRARIALRDQRQKRSPGGIIKQLLRYCFLRAGEWIAVRSSHEVLVLGSANMASLRRLYPSCQGKLTAIRNFPELDQTEYAHVLETHGLVSGRYILSIGRLVAEKRIDMLIDAFCSLDADAAGVTLAIVGDGDVSPMLRAKATGNPAIVFCGEVPHQYVGTLYRHAAVFCLCSAIEGQSLALLEAMSCGCPVLAADIPETAELGQGSITLFRAGDSEDLVRKLQWMLRHPAETAEKALHAKATVSMTHSPQNVVTVIRNALMTEREASDG